MKLNRRKAVLGLGAMATGSGAVFSSATFNNSVSPSSDMRVVVEENLNVEPGILFRDGTNPDDAFDPGSASAVDDETIQNQSDSSLFGGNNDDGLEITNDDLPAAAINDETDGSLFLETAVALGVDDQIGSSTYGVLQVSNETNRDFEIAIRFSGFGPDATSGGSQDQLSHQQVVETFTFKDSNGNQISTSDVTTDPQTVENTVTVSSGGTEQIYLDYDTKAHESMIQDAASIGGNPFNEQTATVDLVDTIEIGTEDTA